MEIILIAAVDDTKTLFHTPVVSSFNNNQISSRVIIRARKSAKGETKLFNPIYLYKNSDKLGLKKQYTSKIQEILKNGNALNF